MFRSKSFKSLTTFKIGAKARYYFEPSGQEELKDALEFARRKRLKIYCIGAGSNILAGDKNVNGVVIKLNSKYFKGFEFRKEKLFAYAGCLLPKLLQEANNRNLSGLEYFVGIPGTLGGVLAMNAGIKEKNIGDLVEDITIMDYNGTIKTLKQKEVGFKYRGSGLSNVIILSACLKLQKSDKSRIEPVLKKLAQARRAGQDWSAASAGCIFKNPARQSAGKLIDMCGLKGKRCGAAEVSFKHANFIINKGGATAKDVLKLMGIIKKEVNKKFKIKLEPEIKIWK